MRVLVTRPKAQGLPFVRHLEQLGAVADLLPAVEVREPADWGPADAAIDRLRAGQYDWVVFTSSNGVAALMARLRDRELDARVFGSVRLAAIGTATAAALTERSLIPDLVPTDSSSEGLAATMVEVSWQSVLLPSRPGVKSMTWLARSRWSMSRRSTSRWSGAGRPDIFDRLRRGEYQAVTLTSPNVAKAILAACDETIRVRFRSGHTALVVNSDRLAKWLGDQGYPSVTAPGPTIDAVVRCLVQLRSGG